MAAELLAPNPDAIVSVRDLVKYFPVTQGIVRKKKIGDIKVVDGVSFDLMPGETLGVVGESGCGKSTVARVLLRLYEPSSGTALYKGQNIFDMDKRAMRAFRRKVQIIFQDPYSSLNPRMTVGDIVAEPWDIHAGVVPKAQRRTRAQELLERVGLNPEHSNRYPHQFSGGQRQRIGVARALALNPEVIICDEPVSALDVSVQAQVVNLLEDLQSEFGLSYIFIAHDLSVVRHISERVAVMYLGKIVEMGDEHQIYNAPTHPYTQALLSAVPVPDPSLRGHRKRIILTGDVPSPMNPPPGCRFHPRCPKTQALAKEQGRPDPWMPDCAEIDPPLEHRAEGQVSACHYPVESRTIEASPTG